LQSANEEHPASVMIFTYTPYTMNPQNKINWWNSKVDTGTDKEDYEYS
jgi:hypothetical protein